MLVNLKGGGEGRIDLHPDTSVYGASREETLISTFLLPKEVGSSNKGHVGQHIW